MSRTVSAIKAGLRPIYRSALHIPIVRDLDLYVRFPIVPNGYRGVYRSFAQAEAAIAKHLPVGYDSEEAHINNTNSKDRFDRYDLPLLPHLETALNASQKVFDWGGGLGNGYYAYRQKLEYPSDLQWQVYEVPAAVSAGRAIAANRDAPGLTFTTDGAAAEGADVFITCGALQYIEPSLAEFLRGLRSKPRYVLVSRVPFYQGEDYITLQTILVADPVRVATICPYKIQNRSKFIADIEAIGYELIDSWKNERTCTIPFHPERYVDGYHGFCFKQVS